MNIQIPVEKVEQITSHKNGDTMIVLKACEQLGTPQTIYVDIECKITIDTENIIISD